ncbi:MAG TPA: NADPH-dependent FMN reductase [bacterium]|nr:NADPH-dependent FMN reductase [bacterium]
MDTPTPLSILGLSGSLRTGSYNRAVLRAIIELAPEGVAVADYDYGDLPLYNGDLEAAGFPPSAQAFKDRIEAADGLIIVTPEYNRGMPGVLKNALDWGTRPGGKNSFLRKPVMVTGASPGWQGTIRAQEQVKDFAIHLGMYLLPMPEVHISVVSEKVNADGVLTDEGTRESLRKMLGVFAEFVRRFKSP